MTRSQRAEIWLMALIIAGTVGVVVYGCLSHWALPQHFV